MKEKKRYEFLEHTADAYVAAYGKDLTEAFENAGVAMFNVITEVEKVNPLTEEQVEANGEDEQELLYNWLEALIVKSEINGMLYSKFKVSELTHDSSGFRLKAKIWGEKFEASRHLQKVGIKAVTYHRMEITKTPEKVTLKFILDI
jgi:SHS2 domain-containing protein